MRGTFGAFTFIFPAYLDISKYNNWSL